MYDEVMKFVRKIFSNKFEVKKLEENVYYFTKGTSNTSYNQAVALIFSSEAYIIHSKGTTSVNPDVCYETIYKLKLKDELNITIVSRLQAGYFNRFIGEVDKEFLKSLKGYVGVAKFIFRYADLLRNFLITSYLKSDSHG